jgi:hypothetical protein
MSPVAPQRSFLFTDESFGFGWYRPGLGGGCAPH